MPFPMACWAVLLASARSDRGCPNTDQKARAYRLALMSWRTADEQASADDARSESGKRARLMISKARKLLLASRMNRVTSEVCGWEVYFLTTPTLGLSRMAELQIGIVCYEDAMLIRMILRLSQ
ncbi:hypothetical protein LX32DRAFT_87718 [Colletotrichum zoysiae]|uniref:Secreted protein n=1 Tax=Colletotrichum zoysiae TaxID=1216348 RepID=A0AAD9M6B0_9PEZI|nr:hypothetical protein LX32DRAFT_87718 [Colletotrichum zoysiae]